MTSVTNSCGTTNYTWDARNRLVGINGFKPDCTTLTASFKYDALNRRIEKTINAVTTKYLYDGLEIIQEKNQSGAVTANYIRGLNIDEPLTRIKADGTIRHYVTDALGSVIALTDDTGVVKTTYSYDPFGNTTVSGEASDNPFQYTGRENDGTGLYYYRARYYSPELQRFISEDPIGLAGGDTNYFAYVGNNPVNWIDPLGLVWTDWQETIFATLEGTTAESSKLKSKTSYGFDTNTDLFVALPDENLKGKKIEIEVNGKTIIVDVGDVGPWNGGHSRKGTDFNDPYWDNNQRPQAECGKDKRGRTTNKAGIDISAALTKKLGLKGNVRLRWRGLP
jgi:RHS repeat-associated protein